MASSSTDVPAGDWPRDFAVRLPSSIDPAGRFHIQARVCYARGGTSLCNMGAAIWEPLVRAHPSPLAGNTLGAGQESHVGTLLLNKHYARPESASCLPGPALFRGRVNLAPKLAGIFESAKAEVYLVAMPYLRVAEGLARVTENELFDGRLFPFQPLRFSGLSADFSLPRRTERYGNHDLGLVVCRPNEGRIPCFRRAFLGVPDPERGTNLIPLVANQYREPFCGESGLELYAASGEDSGGVTELAHSPELFRCPTCFRSL